MSMLVGAMFEEPFALLRLSHSKNEERRTEILRTGRGSRRVEGEGGTEGGAGGGAGEGAVT